MDVLESTVALWRRSAFVWGQTDCFMSVGRYIFDATGVDPVARWRGTYSTTREAQLIYEAHGGFLALAREEMAKCGFATGPRARGRPVIALMDDGVKIAGIDLGDKVAFMASPRGVSCFRADVIEAWVI